MLKDLFFSKSEMHYNDDVVDILRLIRSENIGPKTFFNLVNLFGSATKALENIADLSLRGGRSKPIGIYSKDDAEHELSKLAKNGANIVAYNMAEYSRLLLEIADPPPILSYKGNLKLLNHDKIVAIVGARNSSVNGKAFAAKIAQGLAEKNYVTVSGLARGIDTAVHQASINRTIAVIAGGIDHIYPPENRKLYEEIAANGLIVAELPIGSKPLGQHFPQRNRIISGLSSGTVIVEANLKSGSLITARAALEQNREVFAVPGFPLDPRRQGANRLLKDGAHLVQSVEDIITNLPTYNQLKHKLSDSSKDNLFKTSTINMHNINDQQRKQILELLSSTPINFDELLYETKLPLQVIYTIILELELAGRITRYPGNKFSLVYQ